MHFSMTPKLYSMRHNLTRGPVFHANQRHAAGFLSGAGLRLLHRKGYRRAFSSFRLRRERVDPPRCGAARYPPLVLAHRLTEGGHCKFHARKGFALVWLSSALRLHTLRCKGQLCAMRPHPIAGRAPAQGRAHGVIFPRLASREKRMRALSGWLTPRPVDFFRKKT